MLESSLTASVRLSDEQQAELNRHKRAVRINNEKYFRCHPVRPPGQKRPPIGGGRGRLLRRLRVRLLGLGDFYEEGSGHWAPSHCLGCSG